MGLDMDDRRAPYQQVADALRAAIQDGVYTPGGRLPSVADLADEYRVAKMTVQRALADLRAEGLIVSWQGRGTFVRTGSPDEAATEAVPATAADEIMKRLQTMYAHIQRLDERISHLESRCATHHARAPQPAD